MVSLEQIEAELKTAIKAKDQLMVGTLRGLKARVQNEQIAKTRALEEAEILALIRSEIKRRKEAAELFMSGGRTELAQKETLEAEILEKYLPPQMSEAAIIQLIDELIAQHQFSAKDFGKAMGAIKARAGTAADGGVLAKLLKEKLK